MNVTFPATYPKTIPNLTLSDNEALRPKSRVEAEELLRTKPNSLVGAEMIYEIATCLQDILDQAAQARMDNTLTLEQEREKQQAATSQRTQRAEEEKKREKMQASAEEERLLAEMVKQQKARTERHQSRPQSANNQGSGLTLGKLIF